VLVSRARTRSTNFLPPFAPRDFIRASILTLFLYRSIIASFMALSHNSTLANNEPDWGSVDKTKLPRIAFADQGQADQKSTWSFPHHWVEGGQVGDSGVYDSGDMYLHKGGLMAAWAAAQGAHTGNKASAEVIAHLEAHRKAIGMGDNMMNANATFLAGVDLKDLVTQDLASETEVQIALPGHYIQGDKQFDITLEDFADAAKNFSAAENPLPVDYEHNTFVKGAEAPAAGWVKKVIDRGSQGLYAVIAWTKNAADRIRSGEYKFISPVFFFNARDTRTGASIGTLLGPPALTNFPLIQGMAPVTAKRLDANKKEISMFKKFLAALGITVTDEPTEEKAVELVKAKLTSTNTSRDFVAAKGILAVLDLPETATEDQVKGTILALKNRGDVVSRTDHEALLARVHEQEIEGVITAAMAAGKLTPAMKEGALAIAKDHGIDTLKNYVASLPKVMPVGDKLAPGKREDKGAVAIDDVQAQVNKMMGVSPELFAKYNPVAK
jgi:phage I-like protein